MVGEGVRVTTGQTGLGGLLIKGVGRVGTGVVSLWLGSMLPGDIQLLAEDVAIGSWGGFLVNVTNFASAGSPTTDLGATSQFAASMGARLRAAQMSQMGNIGNRLNKKRRSDSVRRSGQRNRGQLANNPDTSDSEKSKKKDKIGGPDSTGFRRLK